METGPRLQRAFFDRPPTRVAADLIGTCLFRRLASGARLGGRIVEVEAYLGDGTDPAAHSHTGPTPRNRTMFGPPGRLYAYRSYGIHTCINVVCDAPGTGAAVLIRALEPLGDLAVMRTLRGLPPDARPLEIARGPGRLGQALGLSPSDDGASLLRGPIGLYAAPPGAARPRVVTGPRVGITRAAELPYRFWEEGSPWVSAFRPGRPARPAGRARPGRKDRRRR